MDTIREQYHGNVHPFMREIQKGSESDKLAKLVFKHDAALNVTLNESKSGLFGKFEDTVTELKCLNECKGFINDFRIGVRLMVELLQTEE